MAENLIVGTKDCSTRKVFNIMRRSNFVPQLFDRWVDIAIELNVNFVQIEALKKRMLLGVMEDISCVFEVIELWVAHEGRHATLNDLISALHSCGLKALAEELQIQLTASSTEPRRINPQMSDIPKTWFTQMDTGFASQVDLLASERIVCMHHDPNFQHSTKAKNIIVGTDECSLRDVVFILDSFEQPRILYSKLEEIAKTLELSEREIYGLNLNKDFKLSRFIRQIHKLVSIWVYHKEEEATLNKLIEALEANGLKSLAEELANIGMPKKTIEKSPPSRQMEAEVAGPVLMLENESDDSVQVEQISYSPSKYLDEGFMGSVIYKGRHDNKSVAVKQLHEGLTEYFERENNLLELTGEHSNIVKIFHSEDKYGYKYIALELYQATLTDWVEQNEKGKKVENIEKINILRQCVSGLVHLHKMKIVHRNIKPSNIWFVNNDGKIVVKISDLGLGEKLVEGSYEFSGKNGSVGWMAPEVSTGKTGDKIIGAKADIFSLGCVFYYVVTNGGHPFGKQNEPFRRQVNIEDGNFKLERCKFNDFRGMTYLIKAMIDSSPNHRPPLSIISNHPVFWGFGEVLDFFAKINEPSHPVLNDTLKSFEELATKNKILDDRGWRKPASEQFGKLFTKDYQESLSDLIRAIVNYYDEGDKDGKEGRIKFMFDSIEKYVNGWLDLFPKLLPCAWIAFQDLNNKNVKGFDSFYGGKDDPFWKTFSHNLLNDEESKKPDANKTEPLKNNLEVLVGSLQCPIPEVVKTIQGSKQFYLLDKLWSYFEKELEFILEEQKGIKLEFKRSNVSNVSDVIEQWLQQMGDMATLTTLVDAFINVDCNEIAEELRNAFQSSTIST